ncbi:MAG: hypothetical protein QXN66_03350 [Thermoplasmatales archaeon]
MLERNFEDKIKKRMILVILGVIILGGFFQYTNSQLPPSSSHERVVENGLISTENVLYAFPGEIVNSTYYLGQNVPDAIYYEVTLALNSSSFETVNAMPVLETISGQSGHYLSISFLSPNGQPGNWWNIGYEIFPLETLTYQSQKEETIAATGFQIDITSKSSGYMLGFFPISGKVTFDFSQNVTSVVLYPENTQNYTVISAQVNGWNYSNSQLIIYFSLYDYIDSSGSVVPPLITAELGYCVNQSYTGFGHHAVGSGGILELVQGNGAYIMGITSSQMAQILSNINQTLSVPLSQLDAAVVSINVDTATIDTTLGSMVTTLKDINATLTNISAGEAILGTDIGNVKVPLSSINAAISSVKMNTVILETDIGEIQTSISNLNASVTSIHDGVAYLSTAVGTLREP